jgi:hypothetical protein
MLKIAKPKKIKDQFVLVVGDDGAILCHYMTGKLANRIFVDNPASEDTKLISRLLDTYPKLPLTMLVDVIEQNYTQQVLPPVSKFSVQTQVKRRMKRDMHPNDLNNFLFISQQKEGRKDWNFLFISLANTDPFAKWLSFVLQHKNTFKGTYLLPVESGLFSAELTKYTVDANVSEWELLVLHNKTGGFRIVSFRNGKLVFTRLAQNLIGDNIPEVVVGNLEHEIGNTVEYLKRLGFRSEQDSTLTIISSSEVLQKIDSKALKFGNVNLLNPHQAGQRIGLGDYVNDKDKFADIVIATHFASSSKHILKFDTGDSKKVESLSEAAKYAYIAAFLVLGVGILYQANKFYDGYTLYKQIEEKELELKKERVLLTELEKKSKDFPQDIKRIVDIYTLQSEMPQVKYRVLKVLSQLGGIFTEGALVNAIYYKSAATKDAVTGSLPYEIILNVEFKMAISQKEFFQANSQSLLEKIKKQLQGYDVSFTKAPNAAAEDDPNLEAAIDQKQANTTPGYSSIFADIKIAPTGSGG